GSGDGASHRLLGSTGNRTALVRLRDGDRRTSEGGGGVRSDSDSDHDRRFRRRRRWWSRGTGSGSQFLGGGENGVRSPGESPKPDQPRTVSGSHPPAFSERKGCPEQGNENPGRPAPPSRNSPPDLAVDRRRAGEGCADGQFEAGRDPDGIYPGFCGKRIEPRENGGYHVGSVVCQPVGSDAVGLYQLSAR